MSRIMLGVLVLSLMFIFSGCEPVEVPATEIQTSEIEQVKTEQVKTECEHDWVVTSSYNLFLKSYKTYSVCSKCGGKI